MVHTDWWGRGIASEVAFLLCAFGFDRLQLERIEGTCDLRNRASAAVLGKLGMIYEGTVRRTVRIKDGLAGLPGASRDSSGSRVRPCLVASWTRESG